MKKLSTLLCCAFVVTGIYEASAAPSKQSPKGNVAKTTAAKPASGEISSEAAIAAAKALFQKYVALERAFDPAQGNLYAPNAQVIMLGIQGQKVSFDGAMMKDMIKKSMPLAKVRNDTAEYTNVTYTADGPYVTIKCTRHSNLKNYDAPHLIVVASRDQKNWFIVQEVARPQ